MSDIKIYTDGSSRGNPGKGGFAAIVLIDEEVFELGGREEMTTNNRMEMSGVISALSFLVEKKYTQDSVSIFTDSAYVLNGATKWMYGWQKNGWITGEKKEVSNKDLWLTISSLTTEIKNIKWNLVKGHSGVQLNERCDIIATSFADDEPVSLYRGNSEDYKKILEEIVPTTKAKKSSKSTPAFSYVSCIDGEIEIHKTWKECEARVKGKKALFKKSVSATDEQAIVKDFLSR